MQRWVSLFVKNNNDVCRCHPHGSVPSPKSFCNVDCLATTTEVPISWEWHIQATGSWVTWGRRWAQGHPKFWVCREKIHKGLLLPAVLGYGGSFFQIARWEDLQCIFWLFHAIFLTKSGSPTELNLEERNMLFSFQLNCLISSEKKVITPWWLLWVCHVPCNLVSLGRTQLRKYRDCTGLSACTFKEKFGKKKTLKLQIKFKLKGGNLKAK